MNTKELAAAVIEKIQDPKNWTRNASARDKHSREVEIASPEVVRRCALGWAMFLSAPKPAWALNSEVARRAGLPLSRINDEMGRKAVIEALREVAV